MGQVYRARHLQLGKAFALKIISPAFALDTAARARFNEEAKLASEITHPNIVSVVDFGEDATFGAYMVMELVDGEPLISASTGPMSGSRVIDVLGQITDALDHIHRRGIVHGDVKAENIMLTAENDGARRRRVARLLDFGLARRSDADHDEEVSGSPHYLAPERAAGGPPSVAADIYALGVLGYMLLTGTLPFDGTVLDILTAQIHQPIEPPSRRLGAPVDSVLEALIMRALAKDPAQRHGSASAFRAELDSAMDLLDLGRRRRASSLFVVAGDTPGAGSGNVREATLADAFERSRIPQALLALDGSIVAANKGFARLCGAEEVEGLNVMQTTLSGVIPGLMRALRSTHVDGTPLERRARVYRGDDKPALELACWFSPLALPGSEIHLLIRATDEEPRRRGSTE